MLCFVDFRASSSVVRAGHSSKGASWRKLYEWQLSNSGKPYQIYISEGNPEPSLWLKPREGVETRREPPKDFVSMVKG